MNTVMRQGKQLEFYIYEGYNSLLHFTNKILQHSSNLAQSKESL